MCASCLETASLASRPGAIRAAFTMDGAAVRGIHLGDLEITDITLLGVERRGRLPDRTPPQTLSHIGFTLRDPTGAPWIAACQLTHRPADHGYDLASTTIVDKTSTEIECLYHEQDSAERAPWHAHLFAAEGTFWQVDSVSGEMKQVDSHEGKTSPKGEITSVRVSGSSRRWDLQWQVEGKSAPAEGPMIIGSVELRPEAMSYVDPGASAAQRRAASLLFATALTLDKLPPPPAAARRFLPERASKATQLSMSYSQLCVLRDDGGVRCASGHGFTDPEVTGAVQVSAADASGGGYGCAALADGGAQCWPMGSRGEMLGMGMFVTVLPKAERVYGVNNVVRVASFSDGKTCALRRDGSVLCWGKDGAPPGVVKAPTDIAQIQWSENRCDGLSARLKDGTLRRLLYSAERSCELTDGGLMESFLVRATALHGVTDFISATNYACALMQDGTVMCWGYGKDNVLRFTAELGGSKEPRAVPELHDVIQLAGGSNHACALQRGGTVMCWGSNGDGQLGDGGANNRALPGQAQGLTDAVQIAAAGYSTCAIRAAGSVVCWGRGPGLSSATRLPKALDLPP
jgi:hypothetical protein